LAKVVNYHVEAGQLAGVCRKVVLGQLRLLRDPMDEP
jgi:hypothetical protein